MHVSKIQGKAGWWRQGQDLGLWQGIRVCCSFWQWVTRAPGCTELPADLSPSLPPRQQKDERRDTSLSSLPVLGSFQSLPAQKTMASSDQPLRGQKLLASHSSSQSRARPAPHTEEGKSATPEHNSEPSTERTLVLSENGPEGKGHQAPVLHSPDRTHHSKVCFKESQASLASPTSSCSSGGAILCSITNLPCCAMRPPTSLLQLALMWTDYRAPLGLVKDM